MHEITKFDMKRVLNCIHDRWPEIMPDTILWNEIESAAMLGLTEAAIDYNKHRNVTWEWYSLHTAMFRVLDTFRTEINQPCGIFKASRSNPVVVAVLNDSEEDGGPCYKDPSGMIEHSVWPDMENEIAAKEFIECFMNALIDLDLRPKSKKTGLIWQFWLQGYSNVDIANMVNLCPQHVCNLLRDHRPLIIEYMIEHYYSRYPYPE